MTRTNLLLATAALATYSSSLIVHAESNTNNVVDYGADVSFPMHYSTVTDLASERHVLGKNKQAMYQEHLQGCFRHYEKVVPEGPDKQSGEELCMSVESERIARNLRQPQSMVNYTNNGFAKVRAPPQVWNLIQSFWQNNKDQYLVEDWEAGSTFVNHWDSPTHFVSVENATLLGGGTVLKNAIWNAARDTLQQWTGNQLAECSLYGIRIYHQDSILAPHVDRLPLVSSAILMVDQDVDEPWPLEVIGHDGRAHNVTMEPGDLVLYESHSIIHGRPFPLKGRFVANIFIHFEPVGPLGETDPVFSGDLPPYVIPNSPEEPNWRFHNPNGWQAEIAEPITEGATEVHLLAASGDLQLLKQLLDVHPHLIHAVDSNGWAPLHAAVANLQLDVVQHLVERGADINAITNWGDSVLRVAHHYVIATTDDPTYKSHPYTHPMIRYLMGLQRSKTNGAASTRTTASL